MSASSSVDSQSLEVIAPPKKKERRCLKPYYDKLRAKGAKRREDIWRMVVEEGKRIKDVARELGISRQRVELLYKIERQKVIDRQPKTEDDLAVRRSQLEKKYMEIYEDASEEEVRHSAQHLAVRTRVVERLAELYGVAAPKAPAQEGAGMVAMPEELSRLVEAAGHSIHGRGQDIAKAIEAQRTRDVGPVKTEET